jgi:hypothetical protein
MKESETVGGMEGKQEGNAAEGTTGRVVGNSEGVSVVIVLSKSLSVTLYGKLY